MKHMAISVFIVVGEETLIQQRALTKYHTPGLWANSCCTHPYWNEKPDVCARRRVNEELGISNIILKYKDQIEYKADVGSGLFEHEVVDIFISNHLSKKLVKLNVNSDEVMNTRWVTIPKLKKEILQDPTSFTPWLKIYITEHIEKILDN
jgi:isopentenyl-diphosphate delta-isomerase